MATSKTGIGYLRELEVHLVALEMTTRAGVVPASSATCARRILADALSAFCEEPNADLPIIDDGELAWDGTARDTA